MTRVTPLAGDDWGYAINGMKENPFIQAINFYYSWSGRFFSELWGFVVAPRKWLWNILNPLLFTSIYVCTYKLGGKKFKTLLSVLLVLCAMLSVNAALRMQTYTWIMGTTYVVPLCLSLTYFCIYDYCFENTLIETRHIVQICLSNILLFIIGLMMENIAATMIVAIVIMIIYAWFNRRPLVKYLFINLIVSILAFTIMRLSPGSAYRLARDNADWAALNLFEKMAFGYPSFIEQSFLNNRYIICLFSMVLITNIFFSKENKSKLIKIISIFILMLGPITVFSKVLLGQLTFLYTPSSLYSMIFWPIYIINAFIVLFIFVTKGYFQHKAIFFLMMGGTSALVMLFSPFYGERSSLYLVYYLIVVAVLLLNDINTNLKSVHVVLFIILSFITIYRSLDLMKRYGLVKKMNPIREAEIQYYIDHPDDEEAWFKRYPIDTIHSIDIEQDDTYHMETFKIYFCLPQDADKIFFYYDGSD